MKIERLEMHISYYCLNNCFFCSEAYRLKKLNGSFLPKEDVFRKIMEFSKKGYKHITFTGGEPSFHPEFIDCIKFAKQSKYSTYVTTNGGSFSSIDFADETLPYLDEICFSVHGPTSKVHDFLTQKKGSFNNLMKAIKIFETHQTSAFGLVNIVITQYNIKYLKSIISMFSSHKKIKQLIFSNFSPEGGGLKNFTRLVVPLHQLKEEICEIADYSRALSLKPVFFGLPLCILGGNNELSNDHWWSPRTTIELLERPKKSFLKTTHSFNPDRGRMQTKKCKSCFKKDSCEGVFKEYIRIFSDSELSPLKI